MEEGYVFYFIYIFMERVLKECCSIMGFDCINFINKMKSKYLCINMFLLYILF